MKLLLRYIVGYAVLFLPQDAQSALLRLAIAQGVPFFGHRSLTQGCLLCVPWRYYRRFCEGAQAQGLPTPQLRSTHGVVPLIWRYRLRFGMYVGIILFCLLLWISGQFVWQVKIEADGMDVEQASLLLAQYGLSAGKTISKITPMLLQNEILMEQPQIKRININLCGTVAYVEISVKKRTVGNDPLAGEVTLLQAACDGYIEWMSIRDGTALYEPGQTVSQGEILAIGIEDDKKGGLRMRRARGEIWAQVMWETAYDVPYTVEQKIYTGSRLQVYAIDFFKKRINLYPASRFLGEKCDKITKETKPRLLFGGQLPVAWLSEQYLPYTMTAVTRTPEQVQRIAEAELTRRIATELSGAQIAERTVQLTQDEAGLHLHCRILCGMDIAQERKMTEEEIQEIILANEGKKDTDGNT